MSDPYNTELPRNPANFQPLTPLTFLERAASVFPDHTAIIHGDLRRSYAEFYARSRQLASALTQHNVGRGDTVTVMLANTPRELRSEMIDRINSSFKNQNAQLEKSDGGKVLGILRKAIKNDGLIERSDVYEQAIKGGFDESEISTILSKAEAEGILVRAGKDIWKLIEP